jgi:pimeloyl-ACP methyl ester carboxylesterase
MLAALLAVLIAGCAATTSGHGTAVLGSATGSATGSGQLPTEPPAEFSDCSDDFNLSALNFPAGRLDELTVSCATIAVPLYYNQPNGSTITLALVRIHDQRNTTGQDLLVNPGGPGASGVDLAVGLAAQLADTVLTHYDLIGFDPRGVGDSTPINCVSNQQKDELNAASPNVLTTAGFASAKAEAAAIAAGCTAKYGSKLAAFTTVQTAQDMDRIRESLGEATMDYLGFSYGTELGATYVHMFPTKVGRAVLDGAVDPYTDPITAFADQLGGFEGAFDQFANYCHTATPCSSLGDPRQAVYQLVATATANPLSAKGDSRKVTSNLVLTGVLSALYSQSEWSDLGSALIAAKAGDGDGLLKLADEYNERNSDGSYTNIYDANNTISCNDSPPGPSDATIRTTAQQWQQKYPMFGLWAAAALFSCQQWQSQRTPVPVPTAAHSAHEVLVIGNLHDPATPYQGAKDLTKALGDAELLTWNGEGHTSYLEGSSCVDNAVNAYLVAGTMPASGTVCQ